MSINHQIIRCIRLLIFALFVPALSNASDDTLSLTDDMHRLESMQDDTQKISFLEDLFIKYAGTNPDTALIFAEEGLKLSGFLNDPKGKAWFLNDIGRYHYMQGRYKKALDYWLASLKLQEQLGDKKQIAICLNTIGAVFFAMNLYAKAEGYFKRAARIMEELGVYTQLEGVLSNLGGIEFKLKKYDAALNFYEKALQVAQKVDNAENTVSLIMCNMAEVYRKQQKYDAAINMLERSLQWCLNYHDNDLMATIYSAFGNTYYDKGDYPMSLEYYGKALALSKSLDLMDNYATVSYNMAEAYSMIGNYKQAYEYLALHKNISDSLLNAESSKQVVEMETKYQSVKKEKQIALQKLNMTRQQKDIQKQRIMIFGSIAGFIVLLFFTFVLIRQNRIKRQKNKELNDAYSIIAQKNKDITDSIHYAKRIQNAILPPATIWNNNLPDSFVLFKPKDIVSGDFYWMERVNGKVLFSAVDCTGHGVPGAFMSIVGYNGLNKAINEHGLSSPGDILMHLNESVRNTIMRYKGESGVKDGMDLALCCIDKTNLLFEYAGAVNPVYIVTSKGSNWPGPMHLLELDGHTLIEIKGDKYFIGDDLTRAFTNNAYKLMKGDRIFVFSDGYADQFGGPKGKKFKYVRFRKLILESSFLSVNDQCKRLDDEIEAWRGELEQLDDILVIGVQV